MITRTPSTTRRRRRRTPARSSEPHMYVCIYVYIYIYTHIIYSYYYNFSLSLYIYIYTCELYSHLACVHESTSEPARAQLASCTDDVPRTAHGASSSTRGLGSSIIREGNAAALKRTSAHSHPDYTSWQV